MDINSKCKFFTWLGCLPYYAICDDDKDRLNANVTEVCKRVLDTGKFSVEDLLDLFIGLSVDGKASILSDGIYSIGNLFQVARN